MYNGMLNVYKERGYTSHDVVARLRGILKQKKIGHTGTLDPDATGVLPICLGCGTKLSGMITDSDKTYRAVMRLGITTDTQDMSGKILSESAADVSEDQIRSAAAAFIGDYDQVPPMYSAVKVGGRRLYDIARKGRTVERESRRVHIYDLCIENISLPFVTMTVRCSKGTYIRTLCSDIGMRLGCGAAVSELVRTRAAGFDIADSLRLDEIERLAGRGMIREHIVPVDVVLGDYPAARCSDDFDRLLHNGGRIDESGFDTQPGEMHGQIVRAYDSAGRFTALYEYMPGEHYYRNYKMFYSSTEVSTDND